MKNSLVQRITMNKVVDPKTMQSHFVIEGLKEQVYNFKTIHSAAKFVSALPYSYELLAYDEDGANLFSLYRMYEKYSFEFFFNEDAIAEKRINANVMSAFPFEALDRKRQKLGEDKFVKKIIVEEFEDETQSIKMTNDKISRKLKQKQDTQEFKWNKKIAKERMKSETIDFKVKKRKKVLDKTREQYKYEKEVTQLVDIVEKTVNKESKVKNEKVKETFIKNYILKKRNLTYVNNANLMLVVFTLASLLSTILVLILL